MPRKIDIAADLGALCESLHAEDYRKAQSIVRQLERDLEALLVLQEAGALDHSQLGLLPLRQMVKIAEEIAGDPAARRLAAGIARRAVSLPVLGDGSIAQHPSIDTIHLDRDPAPGGSPNRGNRHNPAPGSAPVSCDGSIPSDPRDVIPCDGCRACCQKCGAAIEAGRYAVTVNGETLYVCRDCREAVWQGV